jgi:hypothetical protein
MTQVKPFTPVKLICGMISSREDAFRMGEERLVECFGPIDLRSPLFPFAATDYYEKEMGPALKRGFLSFERLVPPDGLSAIKLQTNVLEGEIRAALAADYRVVNLDPGILTSSALIMATAKNFAHRVPLSGGIYAHLELLFTKTGVKTLDWTYPDFRGEGYQNFFLDVRKIFMKQVRGLASKNGSRS